MREKFKYFIWVIVVSLFVTPGVKAFFIGNDSYNAEEYKEANIIWKHHKIFADDYFFGEHSIKQELAEQLTKLYIDTFKKETGDGTKDEKMYSLYVQIAQVVINISKELSNEKACWQLMYLSR